MVVSVNLGATLVGMLETPNPLVTMRAMEIARSHFDAMGTTTAKQRLEMFVSRADQSYNSSISYNTVARVIDAIEDPRARATWMLESYRKLAEGQVRAWLWLLLPSADDSAKQLPMLGRLEKRLAEDPRPELRALRAFLKPTWRNTAAHEDVQFNDDDQLLDIDGSVVELGEVQARIAEALAFHAGCEIALSNYHPGFEDQTPNEASPTPRAYQLIRARDWFGDNGLLIRSIDIKNSSLVARVESLTVNQLDPCFQAIVLSKLTGVRFQRAGVHREAESTPAVVVNMASISLAEVVWKRVRGFATKNPACTFLPMNFENRKRAEGARSAADAIAWLALNDGIEAFDVAWDLLEGRPGPNEGALDRLHAKHEPSSLDLDVHKYLLQRLKATMLSFKLTTTLDPVSFSRRMSPVVSALDLQITMVARDLRGSLRSPENPDSLLMLRSEIKRPAPAPTLGIWDWEGIE